MTCANLSLTLGTFFLTYLAKLSMKREKQCELENVLGATAALFALKTAAATSQQAGRFPSI